MSKYSDAEIRQAGLDGILEYFTMRAGDNSTFSPASLTRDYLRYLREHYPEVAAWPADRVEFYRIGLEPMFLQMCKATWPKGP